MKTWLKALLLVVLGSAGASPSQAEDAVTPDYARDVEPLLRKYCAGCHGAEEQEGELRLDAYAELLKGGSRGPAIVAGDGKISRMMRSLRGEIDPKMPPEDEAQPTAEEVAVLERWIDAGAKGPDGSPDPTILVTPKLPPAKVDGPITALAFSPDGAYLAAARYGEVDIRFGSLDHDVLRTLRDHPGKVNDLAFSSDRWLLLAATGVAGLSGEVHLWNPKEGTLVGKLQGHRDAILAVAISPDNKTVATGSYDKQIIVWDRTTGEKLHTLTQHNGAIFDLAFSPDGQQLASASADETVKIWNVATGERLATLGQPEGEQYAVLFSPNGERIVAAGADNRIRVWKFVSREKPEINPLLIARFAHEGAIVALAWRAGERGNLLISAADDGTLKAWDANSLAVREIYEQQPDTPSAVAVAHNGAFATVARFDGSLERYKIPDVEPTVSSVARRVDTQELQAFGPTNRLAELEPNDAPESATPLALPAIATGVLHRAEQGGPDFDLFRFAAKKGQTWVLETNAARTKSPADTHIEVLAADGSRIERLKLQAVRDSYFTFRGKDSTQTGDFRVHNWEEMKLNQYLYAQGEVVKLHTYPRGPDSGFNVYPNAGQRHTWFDTTSVSHDLGEPCYIVQPVWPTFNIIPNGLPVFPMYWENDDDAARKLGADSKLTFTAPADGEYLVRVKDRRGFQGENFKYELTIRPPRPDFSVSLDGANLAVNRGSGKMFKLNAGRDDNFDGEIRIDIANVPPGFYVTTPITIEEGHGSAQGAIYAFADAAEPAADVWNNVKLTATAIIDGKEIVKEIGTLGAVKLAEAPKILATLSPLGQEPSPPGEISEVEIQRGETITATLRVTRNGFNNVIAFGGEDAGRNLPHGVYVDNIGLNGVLLLADQNERTVFITADDWVPSTSRLFFLKSNEEDGQCTWPLRLIVK